MKQGQEQEKDKKNKKRIIILCCLLGFTTALAATGFILYGLTFKKSKPQPETDLSGCVCFENHGWRPFNFYVNTEDWNDGGQYPDLEYTLNNGDKWEKYNYESITEESPISIKPHTKMYLRGDNANGFSHIDNDDVGTNTHSLTLQINETAGCSDYDYIKVSGSVMGLLDNGSKEMTSIPCPGCFASLFTGVDFYYEISDDFLPATELNDYCYYQMFSNMSNLKSCPKLPAKNLKKGCYNYMFSGSPDLFELPDLRHIETYEDDCLKYMFYGANGKTQMLDAPTEGAIEFFKAPADWTLADATQFAEGMLDIGNTPVTPEPNKSYYYTLVEPE